MWLTSVKCGKCGHLSFPKFPGDRRHFAVVCGNCKSSLKVTKRRFLPWRFAKVVTRSAP